MDIVIEQITPHHPKARALLKAAADQLETLYPPSSQHHVTPEEAEKGVMLVAWHEGDAIACGILRPLTPKIGEIKRMFVDNTYRRKGLGRKILSELETLAPKLGFETIRLETGHLQPGAIGLYETSGYQRIEPYGEYIDDPMSICFEKRLA